MTRFVHEYTFTADAGPERTFAALTTAAELSRWFAERVLIEPRVGGAFRFSGRGAYAPIDGRVTSFEPSKTFAFTYPIHGVDGEASLTLEPDAKNPGATTLKIRHSLDREPPIARGKELVDDLWRLASSNLCEHVTGGDAIMLVDFADPRPEVRLSIYIDAPPASVFRALIEPELLDKWGAKKAEVEPRVGGRYTFGHTAEVNGKTITMGPTKILELVDNERLAMNWGDWRGDAAVPDQKVTFLLAPEGKGTRVTLVHDGFTRAADISDYPLGWKHGFAIPLKAFCEGKPVVNPLWQ